MDKHFMLIVNPVAGKGQAKTVLTSLLSEFAKHDYRATVYMTTKKGDATIYAREHGEEYELLVCLGGDGTLSEVVSGLMDLEKWPKIGYVPMGTTNDVAFCLGLPKDPEAAVRNIVKGETIPYDIGLFGGEYFTYIAAFGAFTEVSYATPQETKKALGHTAYLLEGVKSLPKLTTSHAKVFYDDGEVEGDFIFGSISNTTRVAGIMKLNPQTVLFHDGLFEVLLVRKPKNVGDLNGIITNILKQKYDHESVVYLHTKEVRFLFEKETSWTRDGENGGSFTEIRAKNIKHGVEIIVS